MKLKHFIAVGSGLILGGVGVVGAQSKPPAQQPANQPSRPQASKGGGTIAFDNTALVDAIDYLRDITGLNINVNWRALEEIGVSKTDPVTLKLKNVTLRQVMKLMLENVSPGNLTYYVDGNVLHVTTKELARKNMVTRVYHIEDLITDLPQFTQAPDFNLQSTSTNGGSGGSGGGSGGGGGQGIFGGNGQNSQQQEVVKTREERAQELIDLITSTIERDVWEVNGGAATIRYFNGTLIITAPREVQEQIGK